MKIIIIPVLPPAMANKHYKRLPVSELQQMHKVSSENTDIDERANLKTSAFDDNQERQRENVDTPSRRNE
jgi:hypothetical protein